MQPTILDLNTELLALKPRLPNANKGDFGHALVIGGDLGFSGAVHMAAVSCARVGCGLVTVVTHPQHAALVNITRPELMVYGLELNEKSQLDRFHLLLQQASIIILGPGLGRSPWGLAIFHEVMLSKLTKPIVLDADALNIIASTQLDRLGDNCIITPHPGEAARLLNTTTAQVQQDRLTAIRKLQAKFNCIVVLKGANTLIKSCDRLVYLCGAGNPGMASGGMGDVLSGVIGGLVAQGLALDAATRLAVIAHATAGDKLAETEGQIGILATDLIPEIRKILNAK